MEEKRFFKRVDYGKKIRCNILLDEGAFRDSITKSKNISGGGIGITMKRPISTEQPISLEMMVPDYFKSIVAQGEVVWMNTADNEEDFFAGVKFTKIDSYDRQIILDYIHFGSKSSNSFN
ncbi:MAG: PilZ domain-containing protein [Candidatus Omnitrophica bacterium]|nr:PilZ domain-containing protein [Candidatus Omnitrophota bacterium]